MLKLYSRIDTKDTYFEMWGASTKHPDVRRTLNDDIENEKFCESSFIDSIEYKFFQWTCQCITELSWGTYKYLKKFMKMCKPFFSKRDEYFY
jgi:hypothetical protein